MMTPEPPEFALRKGAQMVATMKTAKDFNNQESVAHVLEQEWDCVMKPARGAYARVNYAAMQGGKAIALVEIKCRTTHSRSYDTTFLALQKFEAMVRYQQIHGVRAAYVVGFPNEIRWIWVDDVDASSPVLDGRPPRPGTANDIEQMLHVPIDSMRRIGWPTWPR